MLPMIDDVQRTPRYEPFFASSISNAGEMPEKFAANMIHLPKRVTPSSVDHELFRYPTLLPKQLQL